MKAIKSSSKTFSVTSIFLVCSFILVFQGNLSAQYFGRNKPSYGNFDFKVLQTPHFEIYHYLSHDSTASMIAKWSEDWYGMHLKMFKSPFQSRNPLIIYSNQSDFQQTNAVSGLIGVGTGGVTESVKNRIIMPLASTLSQTDHVLGHEMVHAFQFNLLTSSDTVGIDPSFRNLTLWMIEGMAEYLSIGSVDPNTAMWMKDALINDDFPTLKQLTRDPDYFPYRYGHAFWAMIGKTWGDSIIIPVFLEAARKGYDRAFRDLLNVNEENLSSMWKTAMETHYNKYLSDSFDNPAGKKLISQENGGRINVSPSISPDGKYIAFFSEKDLFTLDLYLADATTGKIVKKLSSVIRNHEIDDFSFIESAGTWSPDGKKFAFVIFSKGSNKLAILDVNKATIKEEIEIPGIPNFNGPVWSPKGNDILLSGLVDGATDLYEYDLDAGKVTRLTSNLTGEIHPAWSADGRYVAYAKERINPAGSTRKYSFDLAVLDTKTGLTRTLDVFPGAYNVNPLFSEDNSVVYFLSDRDGFRNLYSADVASGKVSRLTKYPTGISGITPYAPAISLSQKTGKMAYTYYFDDEYQIYLASTDEFSPEEVNPTDVNFDAGTLPPLNHLQSDIVDSGLYNRAEKQVVSIDSFSRKPYKPKFQLDNISSTTQAGIAAGRFGTQMAGSVSMSFSDILGNNQFLAAVSLNGEIVDFGAQAAYLNTKNKVKWGASVSHIPYRYGYMSMTLDTISYNGEYVLANNIRLDYLRMFEDHVSLFAYYPLNQTRRFEAGVSTSWYYFRADRYNNYYSDYGVFLGSSKERMDAPDGFNLQNLDVAYVEDRSFYGMTSPLQGYRSRLQLSKNFGELRFYTILVDYRKYFFIKPIGLAFRLYHYGRYGNSAENDIMSPLYIGYPWLIRGYDSKSIYDQSGENVPFDISNLSGSKFMIANAEIRWPFIGAERLALIKSKWFGADMNLFFDGGLAWDSKNSPVLRWNTEAGRRTPVFSTGLSLRVNLLGYLIMEPYYAIPLQNGGFSNGSFGLNITPGW